MVDISLIKILVFFAIYFVIGFIPLYWAGVSTSSLERFLASMMLIFYASFLLVVISMTTNIFELLAQSSETSKYVQEQTKLVFPLIVFLGSTFTFLFGGVGTNVVTSALCKSDNADILEAIKNIDNKVDNLTSIKESPIKFHCWWLGANTIVLSVGLWVIYLMH